MHTQSSQSIFWLLVITLFSCSVITVLASTQTGTDQVQISNSVEASSHSGGMTSSGTRGADGADGKDGAAGEDGADGADGTSVSGASKSTVKIQSYVNGELVTDVVTEDVGTTGAAQATATVTTTNAASSDSEVTTTATTAVETEKSGLQYGVFLHLFERLKVIFTTYVNLF